MNFNCVNNTGNTLEGFCVLKAVDTKQTAKGLPYLDMIITDAADELSAKFWDYRLETHGEFHPNDIVKLRGTISVYNGAEQFRVERIRLATEKDNVRMEELVPCAPMQPEAMLAELRAAAEGFTDAGLRSLVLAILEERQTELLYWPAAHRLHHAVRAGLLWHTLNVLRLAQAVAGLYDEINPDLLFAGAILHDIEKLAEFYVPPSGLATGYTVAGNLLGHLVAGAAYIDRKGRELQVAPETVLLLQHMLVSHHGDPEYGAAVRPMFLEAEILSELDMLDARINIFKSSLNSVQPGEFSGRVWSLDNRKLYKRTAPGCESENPIATQPC
ncbi:MAG: HD domain-containing protein [Oscillospiraceae bacterium]|jgi:3'-5' exoribonuclease|nr:HD domain-containing protein [Oscillospiraceae bacterium]